MTFFAFQFEDGLDFIHRVSFCDVTVNCMMTSPSIKEKNRPLNAMFLQNSTLWLSFKTETRVLTPSLNLRGT